MRFQTRKGTKVADVIWCSPQTWEHIKEEVDASVAPEICVEVMSSSNTKKEMRQKRTLYFEQGAQEVWICDEEGVLSFFTPQGEVLYSLLAPKFPAQIKK